MEGGMEDTADDTYLKIFNNLSEYQQSMYKPRLTAFVARTP